MKVSSASTIVTAIFPVRLPAPGKRPNRFPKRIKKNSVNMYGKKLLVVMANIGLHNFIPYEDDDWLKE